MTDKAWFEIEYGANHYLAKINHTGFGGLGTNREMESSKIRFRECLSLRDGGTTVIGGLQHFLDNSCSYPDI